MKYHPSFIARSTTRRNSGKLLRFPGVGIWHGRTWQAPDSFIRTVDEVIPSTPGNPYGRRLDQVILKCQLAWEPILQMDHCQFNLWDATFLRNYAPQPVTGWFLCQSHSFRDWASPVILLILSCWPLCSVQQRMNSPLLGTISNMINR